MLVNPYEFIDSTGLRSRREDLDFLKEPAAVGRHAIHMYPAMFHYLLVRELIKEFSEEDSVVFDPFCGTGVALLEGLKLGRNTIGSDINPLAILISKVRCSNLNDEDYETVGKLMNELKDSRIWNNLERDTPDVKNIDYWYSQKAIDELSRIRFWIIKKLDTELSSIIKRLLVIAFSHTSRYVSYVRKGEFKRYRIPEKKIYSLNGFIDAKESFIYTLDRYSKTLHDNPISESKTCKLIYEDIREGIPIEDRSVDLILTSPPYGDSKTTVAYDEFSSFSLEWCNGLIRKVLTLNDGVVIQNKNELASKLLGTGKGEKALESPTLSNILEIISMVSKKRACDVHRFYADLSGIIKALSTKLKIGGHACFLVGNRTVSGIEVPMDLIVKEMFEETGMKLENILVRKIGNKRMPSKNSPTNVAGKTVNTMLYEYMLIMIKET